MTETKEAIYLIDASSFVYRAYHTTGSLSNSKGFPTGAAFGFTNMLMKTLREKQPKRIAVVFDSRGPTFRHERYAEYKANRPPMPEDLSVQIPKIHEIVGALNLPDLAAPSFEADDIIATLTTMALDKGWDVVIVSGDKDLMQLVGDKVIMWDPQRDKVYDSAAVQKKLGVPPSQVRDYLALIGDTSDNIPGVKGVGPKTAVNLLSQYNDLDNIYANLDNITQKKARSNLEQFRDLAFMSRELVVLNHEAPVDIPIDDLAQGEEDRAQLRDLFEELEFSSMLQDLAPRESLDFSGYSAITDMDRLHGLIESARKAGKFAVDTETTSEHPVLAELVGISVCCEPGMAFYIPVGHVTGDQLPKQDVLEALKPLLEDPSIGKIGQNIKYDLIVFRNEGLDIKGISCDTMLASYLLDPSRRSHSMDALSQTFLKRKTIPIKELIGAGKNQAPFSMAPIPKASVYACEDADVTYRLGEILCPMVKEEGLEDLAQDVELPLVPILADMEMAGVRIDTNYLFSLSQEFGDLIELKAARIFESAGEEFNINSPKQLADILFGKMGLKPIKKTKTGPSTSLDVLEALAAQHDLPRLVLEYRSIYKLKSTYVDSLTQLVNPATGRIHTSYNQAVAATGRLSSSDPNLQNIPVRTPEGRKIRQAFIPEDGRVFVSADYSQIELRIMAHISGDHRLRRAFATGEDIHSITAAGVFDCPVEHVTPEMRRKAKAINFGIIYGMGPFKLAGEIGVGLKMAKQYLEEYYETYSGVRNYMTELPEEAAKKGYVTTILGRKRYLPDLNNPNKIAQQAARRVAINTTIQGSAADLIKLAMIHVSEAIKRQKLDAKMILQVHDELILEVKRDEAQEAGELLRREMENVRELTVPLAVGLAKGNNWDEAH